MSLSSAALAPQPPGAGVRYATLVWWAPLALLALCCMGCSPRTPAAVAAAPISGPIAAHIAEPQAEAEPLRVVSAEAVVVMTDGPKGMLTLRQSPQAEMGWPEMTIGYRALGSAMSSLDPGDRIAFELELGGGEGGLVIASRKL